MKIESGALIEQHYAFVETVLKIKWSPHWCVKVITEVINLTCSPSGSSGVKPDQAVNAVSTSHLVLIQGILLSRNVAIKNALCFVLFCFFQITLLSTKFRTVTASITHLPQRSPWLSSGPLSDERSHTCLPARRWIMITWARVTVKLLKVWPQVFSPAFLTVPSVCVQVASPTSVIYWSWWVVARILARDLRVCGRCGADVKPTCGNEDLPPLSLPLAHIWSAVIRDSSLTISDLLAMLC